MDTIDQASKKAFPLKPNPDQIDILANRNDILCFQAGIAFATKFIKVSDELPPNNEKILVKDKFDTIFSFIFHGNVDIKTNAQFMNIIEWRPINFK